MNITSFASKSSYCNKGVQKSKPELCSYVRYDRCIRLPAFFSYFSASLLFTLLHSGAILLIVVKTRGLNEDFSMYCFTCPFPNYSRCYRVICIGTILCDEWNRIVSFCLCGRICTRHAKIIHFTILLDFEK